RARHAYLCIPGVLARSTRRLARALTARRALTGQLGTYSRKGREGRFWEESDMETIEFDTAYSAATGESTGDYVPTISTADGRTLSADFGSLAPDWHALTGRRSFAFGAGNADPIFDPAETATDDQIREWVRE